MKTPPDFYQAPPPQGPVGKRPQSYIQELPGGTQGYADSIKRIPGKGVSILNRDQVRDVARDMKVDALVAYACIMAWGGRNFHNYRLSLGNGNSTKVAELVEYLRNSKATREDDFDYTQKAASAIPGLGISFYTKLLFFLREKPDAYILDQWTAKSAVVLFPELEIKLTTAGLPHASTSPKTYEAFCERLDQCAGTSGWGSAWKNGEEVERTIFDRPGGPWRSWLNSHFENAAGNIVPKPQPKGKRGRPPKPPKAPPGVPPVPPPPGPNAGGDGLRREDRKRAFAGYLREVYFDNLGAGAVLPETCGRFCAPNKLHVMGRGGPIWQFVINQEEVHAEIFFPGAYIGIYDDVIIPALQPPINQENRHQFGVNIMGNGPNNGQTRAIDCYPVGAAGSYMAPAEDWPAICQSAVDAMQQLFEFFEPYLP